jgi:hypothetical protein
MFTTRFVSQYLSPVHSKDPKSLVVTTTILVSKVLA